MTFTQVNLNLHLSKDTVGQVIDTLDSLIGENPNNIFSVETSIHVNSIACADEALTAIHELKSLDAISSNEYNSIVNQIESFKKLFLK